MKQQVLSFLSTIKDEILNINRFLYDANENSFKEFDSSRYLICLLKKYNFTVEENFLDIPNAFYGKFGNGHPQICYICKYSTGDEQGHIFGNNANSTLSIGAAIGLSHVIDKIGGTVIVVGCPGNYSNGSEIIMNHENIFKDISVIFAPHVDNMTSLSGNSQSCVPLELSFKNKNTNEDKSKSTALDISLHTIHFINQLVQQSCNYCYLDHISMKCDNAPREYPSNALIKFELKSNNYKLGETMERNIREYINCLEKIVNIDCKVSLYELPCKELISNEVVSKIFSNNLKECGLINLSPNKNVLYPLSIGNVSHTIPTVYPSISITDDTSISCPSIEFMKCTISDLAQNNIWRGIEALSLSGIDFIERKDLVEESIKSLNDKIICNRNI